MLRIRLAAGAALALAALLAFYAWRPAPASAQQACGVLQFSHRGATYRVLFARNRAVQQYKLVKSSNNMETDHDVLQAIEARFGPEEVNAPPLRIVQYRSAEGGMRVPVKAVDSCGRTIAFR